MNDMTRYAIDAIANFAKARFVHQPRFATQLPMADDAQALGQLLWDETVRSAECVRGEVTAGLYVWTPSIDTVTPLQFLKLLDCLEHESNATADYHERPAYLVLDAMRRRAIRLLPGYEEAPLDFGCIAGVVHSSMQVH